MRLALPLLAAVASAQNGAFLEQLDAMGHLHGDGDYDRRTFDEIVRTMTARDPRLKETSDAAWRGFLDYFRSNGEGNDRWGSSRGGWNEFNVTAQPPPFVPARIHEPCNYASNAAYYRAVPEINARVWDMSETEVVSLTQGFSILAFGSAFMHGSHTSLGGLMDVRLIDLIAFTGHQASVAHLPCTGVTCNILRGLSREPRRWSAAESTMRMTEVVRTQPVNTWRRGVEDSLDTPQYFTTFAAIIVYYCHFIFEQPLIDVIVPILMPIFGISLPVQLFILFDYIPAVRAGLRDIIITPEDQDKLLRTGVGAIIKLLWAFVWQEGIFRFPFDPEWNRQGAELMPFVNELARAISGYNYVDESVQRCENVYPGDDLCRPLQPHSKWHEISAIGLFDLMVLCDEVGATTRRAVSNLNVTDAKPLTELEKALARAAAAEQALAAAQAELRQLKNK